MQKKSVQVSCHVSALYRSVNCIFSHHCYHNIPWRTDSDNHCDIYFDPHRLLINQSEQSLHPTVSAYVPVFDWVRYVLMTMDMKFWASGCESTTVKMHVQVVTSRTGICPKPSAHSTTQKNRRKSLLKGILYPTNMSTGIARARLVRYTLKAELFFNKLSY